MDEKYDVIDELLDFGNINPTTEEIIKQLLEDLVGHVEKPYMILLMKKLIWMIYPVDMI